MNSIPIKVREWVQFAPSRKPVITLDDSLPERRDVPVREDGSKNTELDSCIRALQQRIEELKSQAHGWTTEPLIMGNDVDEDLHMHPSVYAELPEEMKTKFGTRNI